MLITLTAGPPETLLWSQTSTENHRLVLTFVSSGAIYNHHHHPLPPKNRKPCQILEGFKFRTGALGSSLAIIACLVNTGVSSVSIYLFIFFLLITLHLLCSNISMFKRASYFTFSQIPEHTGWLFSQASPRTPPCYSEARRNWYVKSIGQPRHVSSGLRRTGIAWGLTDHRFLSPSL